MQTATTAVCLAYSDDEDYVSFSEEEMNDGIGALYDSDSASDFASDCSDDDVHTKSSAAPRRKKKKRGGMRSARNRRAAPQSQPVPQQQEQAETRSGGFFSGLMSRLSGRKAEAETVQPQHQQIAAERAVLDDWVAATPLESINAIPPAPQQPQSAMAAPELARGDSSEEEERAKEAKLTKRLARFSAMRKKKDGRKSRKVVHRQKVSTNVIRLELGTLEEGAQSVATGDPYRCENCPAVLCALDELKSEVGDMKLDSGDEVNCVWECKFCAHTNLIEIDDEEKPSGESVDYVLEPPQEEKKSEEEGVIIFCVDTSGSMCVTQEFDGSIKLKGEELLKDLQSLNTDGEDQYLPGQKRDTTWISRLQCVQAAVNEQIEEICKSKPKYKIGLVTFADDVNVIGDAMSPESNTVVTGDKLSQLETLKEIGNKTQAVDKLISDSLEPLSAALWKLQDKGQTALGPALVVSIALAASQTVGGSQVILCTDGLANIGVGALDAASTPEEEEVLGEWYETLGAYAMGRGVTVSVISITDDGCKMENLGKLKDATNGYIRRINPLNLSEKFAGIVDKPVLATKAQATMLLHPALGFDERWEAEMQLKEQEKAKEAAREAEERGIKAPPESEAKADDKAPGVEESAAVGAEAAPRDAADVDTRKIDVGNVFNDTEVFFQYVVKRDKIEQYKLLKSLPLQVQIEYMKPDGTKMLRVISQLKPVVLSRERVREEIDMDVMARHATKQAARLCNMGAYEQARSVTASNTRFLHKNARRPDQLKAWGAYVNTNVGLDNTMKRQQRLERVQERDAGYISDTERRKKRKQARDDKFSSHMYQLM